MGTYKTWICEACDVSSYLHLMAKFCTSLLSVSSSSMEPSIMVRDQHHTAASRLEKRICEQYPRQNRSMKSWWFFSGSKKKKKKRLTSHGKYPSKQKERRCWQSKGQRPSSLTFCTPRPKNTILGLRSQSVQREAQSLSVFQDNHLLSACLVSSQMLSALHPPVVPKRSTSTRSTLLAIWAVVFPFPHPSLTSQIFVNGVTIFISKQKIFDFFPFCWVDEEFATGF